MAMALVEWNREYSVGIQSIDLQHQKLFEMINELYNAMRAGNVAQVVPAILKRLETYCREHFAHEENMMLRAEYPDYSRHKHEHAKLLERALTLGNDFNESRVVRSLTLLTLLKEWTQRHILSSDKQYSSHLIASGVTDISESPARVAPASIFRAAALTSQYVRTH
jgi:hemerythrin-like metal-binding protein